jgi:hypothetical protein
MEGPGDDLCMYPPVHHPSSIDLHIDSFSTCFSCHYIEKSRAALLNATLKTLAIEMHNARRTKIHYISVRFHRFFCFLL